MLTLDLYGKKGNFPLSITICKYKYLSFFSCMLIRRCVLNSSRHKISKLIAISPSSFKNGIATRYFFTFCKFYNLCNQNRARDICLT